MTSTMIAWKLKNVMREQNISVGEMAEDLGLSRAAIANLRSQRMPKIDGDRLNSILLSLNKRRKAGTPIILPGDLFEFFLSLDEAKEIDLGASFGSSQEDA